MNQRTNKETKKTFNAQVIEFVSILLVIFLIRTFGFGLYQVPTGSMETTMLVGERFFADKCSYLFRAPARGDIISFNDPEYVFSKNPVMRLFENYVWGPANWTKRVIGVPGDVVRGVVEDGKPVVYLNGKKLDEAYLNKHPLIHLWTQDPDTLRKQIETELKNVIRAGNYTPEMLDRVLAQKYGRYTTWRSYDPAFSFENQPFYRINPAAVIRSETGEAQLLQPGTQIRTGSTGATETNKHFWNESDNFHVELGPDEFWCMGDNRLGSKDCRFFGPVKRELIHGRIVFRIWSMDSTEDWWIVDLIKHPIDFWSRIRWSRFLQWVY